MKRTATMSVLLAMVTAAACLHADVVAARAPAAKRAAREDAPPSRATADRGEPIEGFGARARGGDGRIIVIDEPSEQKVREAFKEANRGGDVTVRFDVDRPIAITRPLPQLTAPHLTIDGGGATLDGSGLTLDVALLDVRTNDVLVRNLCLRNGYDNLRVQGPEAFDVAISHVSSTGALDDGISIGYGARDVTVQYAFFAGNTRSFFCKYGGAADVSLHHSWMQKAWIRSALFSGAGRADVRNVIVEDWTEWGTRFENGATGNVVSSLFTLSPYARGLGGKPDAALRLVDAGPVYLSGNVVRGEIGALPKGTAGKPLTAPAVRTASVPEMEKTVRARAGCLPRDEIDRAYIAAQSGWTVGENAPLRDPPSERAAPVIGSPPAAR